MQRRGAEGGTVLPALLALEQNMILLVQNPAG